MQFEITFANGKDVQQNFDFQINNTLPVQKR